MPVNKDDDDYFSGKIAGEFEDFLLNEFTTLKKLDDFLKVFIFYHIERLRTRRLFAMLFCNQFKICC